MSKQPHRARNLSIGSSTQLCPIVLITPEGEAFIGKRYPGAFVWIDPDQYIREVAGDDNTEKEKAMRAMLSKALETVRQDKVAATAA